MIGTYAAVLAVCGASLAIGQAAIGLCGVRRWSWLSPAVGLALLSATGWATVRLPGEGAIPAALVLVATIASLLFLRGRLEGGREALRAGAPVALGALLAGSLPFIVEGHFGILGTGFNPDMSQHLLATDRLAEGAGSQLSNQGYPLGPHAVVAALHDGLGIGLVQGFGGLTLAVAVLAPLTALTAFGEGPPLRQTAAALLVGLPYLVASYYAQGSFKETMQALYVLAFVLALRESTRPEWRQLPLRFVPAALVAIGSVYAYSFAGLIWLAGIATIWAAVELGLARYASSVGGVGVGGSSPPGGCGGRGSDPVGGRSRCPEQREGREGPPTPTTGPAVVRAAALAILVFAIATLPELGRMIDFQRFETFDPDGPGLGNLFGQVSPFTALGIWFSGDFRVAAGDGAVPALVYYLGAALAAALLVHGLSRCLRGRETAILAGAVAVAGIYLAARIGGTPYTSAKALGVAAPLLALVILLPLAGEKGSAWRVSRHMREENARSTRRGALFGALAVGCSLLAFANAPVGPTSYSPALTGLRPLLAGGSTLMLAPDRLLEEEQGYRYLAWELRGGRVCIEPEGAAGRRIPPGVRFVIAFDDATAPPFRGLTLSRRAGPYLLWERAGPVRGRSGCPLIAVRQARQGG